MNISSLWGVLAAGLLVMMHAMLSQPVSVGQCLWWGDMPISSHTAFPVQHISSCLTYNC